VVVLARLFLKEALNAAKVFALYTFGLGRLGAGRAAIVATVEPVALGAALLAEDLTFPKVAGALLVISGATLAQVRVPKWPILAFVRQNGYYVTPR
jgi:drug/metabolite transporter, DME family